MWAFPNHTHFSTRKFTFIDIIHMIKAEELSIRYSTRVNGEVKIQIGRGAMRRAYALGGEQ